MWLWWGRGSDSGNTPTLGGRAGAERRLGVVERVLVVFDLEPLFVAGDWSSRGF
jgi:hypothetical protein